MAARESEKIILIVVVAIVIILVFGAFSMMGMMSGYGWGGMGPGMMGWRAIGYGWWMPVVGIVFLIVLIAGLYLVFSAYRKPETR